MYIIGLSGKAGSGKDTVGKIMHDLWGYYPLPLSLMVKLDAISKWGISYEAAFIKKPPAVRKLLQEIGTENGRDQYGKEMWIRGTHAFAKWINETWGIDKFVITDIRFINELEYLKDTGSKVIRVIADATLHETFGLKGNAARHISETELDSVPITDYDATIFNEFNKFEYLQEQVEDALIKITWGMHKGESQ